MEAVALSIGLHPIISRGYQVVNEYRTGTGTKERTSSLRDQFISFETDLAACISRLQENVENVANLPQQSRAAIDNDAATLTDFLTSAHTALQSIIKGITPHRMLRFLRDKTIAKDCEALVASLEEAQKLLRDADMHVDLGSEVEGLDMGKRKLVNSIQKSFPQSSSATKGSASRGRHDTFHAHYDVAPFDLFNLVFDFEANGKNGIPSTREGRLLNLLLDESPNRHREVAVCGICGVGKTSLLNVIMSLHSVRQRFRDGVYNISLGMDATLERLIESMSMAVQNSGGEGEAEAMRADTDMKDVMGVFRSWFANKRCLFVVDDVWATKEISDRAIHELRKLYVSGRDSKVLLSTRSPAIASETDTFFSLEPRDPLDYESRAILLRYSGIVPEEGDEDDNRAVNKILEICDALPLFLAVAGKFVRTLSFRNAHGGSLAYHAYARMLEDERSSLLTTDVDSFGRLLNRLSLSITLLEERKQQFGFLLKPTMANLHRRLSVLKKKTRVPMSMLKHLWELEDESQASAVAREFERVGLADIHLELRESGVVETLQLHDSVYEFAVLETQKHGEQRVWHETLVRRYHQCLNKEEISGEWWRTSLTPDGYIHENICRHLLGAGRASELVQLLLKPQWTERQLDINGNSVLSDDFSIGVTAVQERIVGYTEEERSETEKALQLISDAITLSSPMILENKAEHWFQLHGRLKIYASRLRPIREYVGWMTKKAPRPMAMCLNDFLRGPGGTNTKMISSDVPLFCMVMLGDRERVACGCGNGAILVANIPESEIEKRWTAHDDVVVAIAVERNGTRLVSGSHDGKAKVWDIATGECIAIFEGHTSAVQDVEVIDQHRVVSVSWDGTAQIWDIETGQILSAPIRGHEGWVTSVAVLSGSDEFITGGEDGKLILRDATSGLQVGVPFEGHENYVSYVIAAPDGRRVVSGSADGTVKIWDVESHELLYTLEGNSNIGECLALSPDASRVASGSTFDGMIRLWDLESGTQIRDPLEGHRRPVTGLSFLESGDSIVSCSSDGTLRAWDARRSFAGRVSERHGSAVEGVAFSPNGRLVVSASADKTLRIWDSTTGQSIGDAPQGHSDSVTDVATTADGRFFVSVSQDQTVRVWDLESHSLQHTLTGHTGTIWCVAVTPDGRHVLTGSSDRTVRMWDMSTMDDSHIILEGHTAAVWRVFVHLESGNIQCDSAVQA